MNNEHRLTVISGPSGCGKDTVVRNLLALRKDCRLSVSCTTRAPRPGEEEGVDYFFITREEFERRIAAGDILEYNEYAGNLYGTAKTELESAFSGDRTVILVIDVNGGRNVKKAYPGAQLIFLVPPSEEELKRRLLGRNTETPESLERRLAIAREEMKCAGDYDVTVVNDSLDRCVKEVLASIDAWQAAAEERNRKENTQNEEKNNSMKTPIGRLLEEKESAYSLVIAVAKRARDIVAEAEEKGTRLTEKPVTMAIDEFDRHVYDVKEEPARKD